MQISRQAQVLGVLLEKAPDFLVDMGALESFFLKRTLEKIPVTSPIFICGLARSGSTLLLELLDQHPATASFRYYDYPFVHCPVFWRQLSRWIFKLDAEPVERAHKDKLMVSPLSPEAFEEILWMHFFKDIHREDMPHVITEIREEFKDFYVNTIKKVLHTEKATRYLSKENYNICRISGLKKIFPDAKFIVPIRHPVTHVGSLLKQQALLLESETENRAILQYMQRVGHFEFGLDRRAINTGDPQQSRDINALFKQGHDVLAYASQWSVIYDYARQQFANDSSVRFVKYDELCHQPVTVLKDLFAWLDLSVDEVQLQDLAKSVVSPDYYQPSFSEKDIHIITSCTQKTASSFGYTDAYEKITMA